MYRYEEPSMFSGKRGAVFVAVILLHLVIVWGFYSGLASNLIQKIIPPVEIAQIEKPKEVDKPPPPPPKMEEVKPFVPPPEFVDIQAPQQETTAISQTTQVQQAPAPIAQAPPAPPPPPGTSIKQDPKHPLHIGPDWYPDASRRANEEGRCTVIVTVSVDGKITGESLQTSSGFPRLDEACLKAVHGQRMIPATENGKPVEKTVSLPIAWRLSDK
jgi:periplasmic protein TonB